VIPRTSNHCWVRANPWVETYRPGFISYAQGSLSIALNVNQKEFLTPFSHLYHILSCLPGRSEVQVSPISKAVPDKTEIKLYSCFVFVENLSLIGQQNNNKNEISFVEPKERTYLRQN
jgi:hypothetical protein